MHFTTAFRRPACAARRFNPQRGFPCISRPASAVSAAQRRVSILSEDFRAFHATIGQALDADVVFQSSARISVHFTARTASSIDGVDRFQSSARISVHFTSRRPSARRRTVASFQSSARISVHFTPADTRIDDLRTVSILSEDFRAFHAMTRCVTSL